MRSVLDATKPITSGPFSSATERAAKAVIVNEINLLLDRALPHVTLAALNANLDPAAGVAGVVINDPLLANNGIYIKVGASGAGSWTRSTTDPHAAYQAAKVTTEKLAQFTLEIPPTRNYMTRMVVLANGRIVSGERADASFYSSNLASLGRRTLEIPPTRGQWLNGEIDANGRVVSGNRHLAGPYSATSKAAQRLRLDIPPCKGFWVNAEIDTAGRVLRGNRHIGGAYSDTSKAAARRTLEIPPNKLGIIGGTVDADFRLLSGVRFDATQMAQVRDDTTLDPLLHVKTVAGNQQIFRVAGNGETQVTLGTSNSFAPVAGRVPRTKRSFLRFISDAHLGRNLAYRSKGDGSLRSPELGMLMHIIIYGQSLSVGAFSVPVISFENTSPNAWMFNSGVRCGLPPQNPAGVLDGTTLTSLIPLHESQPTSAPSNAGETLASGMANWLTRRQQDNLDTASNYLFSNAGTNSAPMSQLVQGTQSYANLLTMVTRGKALADSLGLAYIMPCIVFVHGEADHANAAYAAQLNTLQTNLDTDIRAIVTAQTLPVQLLLSQHSSWTHTNQTTSVGVLQQLLAANTYPNIHCYAAKYHAAYPADGLHTDAISQLHEGERAGKALELIWFSANAAAQKFQPLQPVSASRVGNIVTALFNFGVANGPIAPGVIDTSLVTDTAAQVAGSKLGFEYVYNGAGVAITAAVVNPDGVSINYTLASNPGAPGTELLRGGVTGVSGNPAGPTSGPRVSFRDSDTSASPFDGTPLYNYCTHFEIALT